VLDEGSEPVERGPEPVSRGRPSARKALLISQSRPVVGVGDACTRRSERFKLPAPQFNKKGQIDQQTLRGVREITAATAGLFDWLL
jgi:hypothetical protein